RHSLRGRAENENLAAGDEREQARRDFERPIVRGVVKLHVAGRLDDLLRRTDGDEARAIGPLARQDAVVLPEHRRNERAQETVARQRAVGNPSVRQQHPHARGTREARRIRPDLRLHRRRSEEHTSELQSRENLVCRLLLEKKKKNNNKATATIYL